MDEQRAWIRSRRRKRLRLLAAALSACLLFTSYPDILAALSVSAVEAHEEGDSLYLSGFARLPEEIREQTVPLGTELEELTLPSSLEAVITETPDGEEPAPSDKDDTGEEMDSSDEDSEGEGNPSDEDSEGEEGDPSDEDGEGEESDPSDEDENDGKDGEDSTEQEITEEADGEEEDTDTENIEEQDEQSEKSEEEAGIEQTTYTVTLPEYQAENVISVETLENTQDTEPENAAETTVTISGVTWQSDPEYDGNIEGTYIFTAVLPDGYALAEGVSLPKITVTVQEINIDIVVQTLLDRIAALPEAENYLSEEPEAGDEEAYAEWEEKLYEYAEEALAIWEEYEALTEEQQAQIPEEELAKLKAWVELAEQLAETDRVMLADDSEHHAGWTPLSDSDTELDEGNYYLADDVTMNTIVIKGTVTLCLNGHTLTHSGNTGSVIEVQSGTFTLCDCEDHWGYTSSFDKDTKTYTCEVIGNGGCITGGTGTVEGSYVYGGGVYVCSGATFNMTGGRIKDCDIGTASNHYGGGVYVTGGTFNMSGGFVDKNTANTGGGVYLTDAAKLNMSGNAIIMNNNGNGGGVYAYNNTKCVFNMSSGKILGNKTTGLAGGIFLGATTEFNMTGGVIEGNSTESTGATTSCGGLYANTATVNLSGGCIQYNTATAGTGGFRDFNNNLNP